MKASFDNVRCFANRLTAGIAIKSFFFALGIVFPLQVYSTDSTSVWPIVPNAYDSGSSTGYNIPSTGTSAFIDVNNSVKSGSVLNFWGSPPTCINVNSGSSTQPPTIVNILTTAGGFSPLAMTGSVPLTVKYPGYYNISISGYIWILYGPEDVSSGNFNAISQYQPTTIYYAIDEWVDSPDVYGNDSPMRVLYTGETPVKLTAKVYNQDSTQGKVNLYGGVYLRANSGIYAPRIWVVGGGKIMFCGSMSISLMRSPPFLND